MPQLTIIHPGTCECGAERKALRFTSGRINKHSIRTKGPDIIFVAPCPDQDGPRWQDDSGHAPDIDWQQVTFDKESQKVINDHRRKRGWLEVAT